jgi:hypothetical protein
MSNDVTAQKSRYPVHELSVSVAAGTSNLIYKLDKGSHSGGLGGSLEVGYMYNVKKSFGIVTGLGVSLYNSKLSVDECEDEYKDVDDFGDEFTFNYSLTGYTEKHSIALFTVPVLARYTTPLGQGSLKYYVSGGIKLGIPIVANASIFSETVTTSGHYVFENGTYTDLPQYGFVNGESGTESEYKIKLGIVPLLALETGIRFEVGYQKDLMIGVYCDYSLSNIQKSKDRHILEYQPLHPSQFLYNSIINTKMLDKVNFFNAGLKIGLSF